MTTTTTTNQEKEKPPYDTFVSIFIHFGLFSHLQNITKTLTLLMLGFYPMRVLFFLQLSLPIVHALLHSHVLIF
jgi:hypothetical protein